MVIEIFCTNWFTSGAPSFGLHPRFAIDHTTEWDFDEPDQEAEAFRLRETMPPKLLVGPPSASRGASRKTPQWANSRSKRSARTPGGIWRQSRRCTTDRRTSTTISFTNIPMEPSHGRNLLSMESSAFSDARLCPLDPQRCVCHRVKKVTGLLTMSRLEKIQCENQTQGRHSKVTEQTR